METIFLILVKIMFNGIIYIETVNFQSVKVEILQETILQTSKLSKNEQWTFSVVMVHV